MPAKARWRGVDIAGQLLDAAEQLRDIYDGDPLRIGRHLPAVVQAGRELRSLIRRIKSMADDGGIDRMDYEALSQRDALQLAIFFETLARLQRSLVDADMDALRIICRTPALSDELVAICEAMSAGEQREATSRLARVAEVFAPDELPPIMIHAAATWRQSMWYDFDHEPLAIGEFLMIDSRERLLWFCNRLLEFHEIVEPLGNRAQIPRRSR